MIHRRAHDQRGGTPTPAARVRCDHGDHRRPERLGIQPLEPYATASPPARANLAVPEALILFMFMFSFVLALSASAIASPSISSEVESGVLMTIVTRPIRRSEVLLGKWLGLATLLAGYAAGVCALEFVVVRVASGFVATESGARSRVPVRRGRPAADAGAVPEHAGTDDRRRRDRSGRVRRRMARRRGGHARARHSMSPRCGRSGKSDGCCFPPTGCGTPPSTTCSRARSSRSMSPTARSAIRSTHREHPHGRICCGWPAGSWSFWPLPWRVSSDASCEPARNLTPPSSFSSLPPHA